MDVCAILGHPQFMAFINTLCIRLDPCMAESLHACPCDETDKTLGRALCDLLNLKALNLTCQLCSPSFDWRHQYIATLRTNVLQEIRFTCICSDMEEKTLVEYLGAPCMTSLTTLKWSSRAEISANGQFKDSLSNQSMLPNLRNLYYCGDTLDDLLLSYRPIQRISLIDFRRYIALVALKRANFVEKIDILTHISVQFLATAKILFSTATNNPFPFRNLQHLGAFWLLSSTCSDRGRELCDTLSTLAALKSLVSVQARCKNPNCVECRSHREGFRSGLGTLPGLFPNLVWVFVMRVVEGYSVWDIWRYSNIWHLEMRDHRMDEEVMIRDWPAHP
ncbi:hypothetical protein CPB86DRAFT_104317 [Serendipita vermifera]|nr:hypothetical protein CPB86DRAFT_104317 [Serendipita vermifera]